MYSFLEFLEYYIPKSTKLVSFTEISMNGEKKNDGRLRIVIDADTCLDRLYGGFTSNWIAGSDYMKMLTFFNNLVSTCYRNNIEIIIYFNGTSPKDNEELLDWQSKEKSKLKRIASVIDFVTNERTINPHRSWVRPPGLIRQIVNQLRTNRLNRLHKVVHTFNTVKHHHKEIIEFCKVNKCEYLISSDYEMMMHVCSQKENVIRLFSAKSFKLTLKGAISALEYDLNEISEYLKLKRIYFPVLGILMKHSMMSDKHVLKFMDKLYALYPNELVTPLFLSMQFFV